MLSLRLLQILLLILLKTRKGGCNLKLGKKREITEREMVRILLDNGFEYVSQNKGTHKKFKRDGKHVIVNKHLNMCVARRIIKENNLIV